MCPQGICTCIEIAPWWSWQFRIYHNTHCIQFYKWHALTCMLWLQNSCTDYFTTQCRQQLGPTKEPEYSTCPSSNYTQFSASAHPQDGCLQQPQSSGEQNGHQSNAHQRCLHVPNGATNCKTTYGTGKRRFITSSFKMLRLHVCGLSMCLFCIYLWVTKQCEINEDVL